MSVIASVHLGVWNFHCATCGEVRSVNEPTKLNLDAYLTKHGACHGAEPFSGVPITPYSEELKI